MRVNFILICEGSSDRGLVPHLEELCVRAGADEATGDAPDLGRLPHPPGKAVEDQVRAVLELGGDIQLLFVHRDADGKPGARRRQIHQKMADLEGLPHVYVCVVPVQELEAWLLADEHAIRTVVGNPGGREDLGLPPRGRIESEKKPKECLKAALVRASEESGARLEKVRQRFPHFRAVLLERLDIDGPVSELPAWKHLVADVERAIRELRRVSDQKPHRFPRPR